jgi:hypothetical protein
MRFHFSITALSVVIWLINGSVVGAAPQAVSLAGQWRFGLDRLNTGIRDKWFARELAGGIRLPGSLPAQGIGDDVSPETKWMGGIVDRSWFTAPEYEKYRQPGNVKVPFWLQPEKYYSGVAWYQRDVHIPRGWEGKRVVLTLERPHWETRVWIDETEVGVNSSLSTPHQYNLGAALSPGKHRLTIRVDNGLIVDVGINSHSITDHTQGNWNGIEGDIFLRATPPVWIEDLQAWPRVADKAVTIKGRIQAPDGTPGESAIRLTIRSAGPGAGKKEIARVSTKARGGAFTAEIPLGPGAQVWDEFHPVLYEAEAVAEGAAEASSTRITFGLREITTRGTQFVLNGRNLFVRGTLECCIFPKTDHPPTDVRAWKRIIGAAKAHGLNLIRFHSWCPPEAAFRAADELGFYYQVEVASWANQSSALGNGKAVDQWLYDETDRILAAYGNHPSFLLLPYGNEPGGKNANAWLAKWVEHYKARDARRLYTSGSGWPQLPENQFHVTPDPRVQAWGAGLKSRINARPPETTSDYREYITQRAVPVISHEIGQWCVYPNFDEIPKYTGYLKPKNFDIFRDLLNAHGMGRLARPFLIASGKLQALCYKEDIESALRTPGMGGFQLLDLHDFPGQGTALVGVLDPFWEEKGYITPAEFRRFCNETVPLARLQKRVFTQSETLEAALEAAHFGPEPASAAKSTWKIVADGGRVVASGALPPTDLPINNGIRLGQVNEDLAGFKAPARYKLVVTLATGPGKAFENDWDFWVYPSKRGSGALPEKIMLTSTFDAAAQQHLQKGGSLLLTIPPEPVRNFSKDPVKLGFSSIFWNTAWTHRQAPTTLGILCDPKHAALAKFPTEPWSNWQWWYLVSRAGALRLDGLPDRLEPVVRVIDDWFTARPLGLVIEGRAGPGRLVVCGFDLTRDLEGNPVARQMLDSLVSYMSSGRFRPKTELSMDQIRNLAAEPKGGAGAP